MIKLLCLSLSFAVAFTFLDCFYCPNIIEIYFYVSELALLCANCTHLCPEICHAGQFLAPDKCCKRLLFVVNAKPRRGNGYAKIFRQHSIILVIIPKIYQRISLDLDFCLAIQIVRAKHRRLIQHDICVSLKFWRKKSQEMKSMGQSTEKGVNRFKRKFVASIKQLLLFIIVVVALIAETYYGYKGLLTLFDWMNEVNVPWEKRRHQLL